MPRATHHATAPVLLHRALAGKVGVPLLVADAYSLRLDEEDLKDDSAPPGLVVRCVRCAAASYVCIWLLEVAPCMVAGWGSVLGLAMHGYQEVHTI